MYLVLNNNIAKHYFSLKLVHSNIIRKILEVF